MTGNVLKYNIGLGTTNGTWIGALNWPLTVLPLFVARNSTVLLTMTIFSSVSTLLLMELSSGTTLLSRNISNTFKKMNVTSDFTKAFLWTSTTSLLIINVADLTDLYAWNPPVTPVIDSTGKITFNQANSLAIIETDSSNRIFIMNLGNFEITNAIVSPGVVREAYFLDPESTIVMIIGTSNLIFKDLVLNREFSLSPKLATAYACDKNYHLYTCAFDIVEEF